jgi:hypothetical protein
MKAVVSIIRWFASVSPPFMVCSGPADHQTEATCEDRGRSNTSGTVQNAIMTLKFPPRQLPFLVLTHPFIARLCTKICSTWTSIYALFLFIVQSILPIRLLVIMDPFLFISRATPDPIFLQNLVHSVQATCIPVSKSSDQRQRQ